jgi:hypothetical protein
VSSGPVSREFLKRGIEDFREACRWVQALPYGCNSSHEDSLIVFEEMSGVCYTKHGVIARLAREMELDVRKAFGFYRLNDEIVTGVNRVLERFGLEYIPQMHCFLIFGDCKIDLTEGNCTGKNKLIESYDFIVAVEPDMKDSEKMELYRKHLRLYFEFEEKLKSIGEDRLLEILQDCNGIMQNACAI